MPLTRWYCTLASARHHAGDEGACFRGETEQVKLFDQSHRRAVEVSAAIAASCCGLLRKKLIERAKYHAKTKDQLGAAPLPLPKIRDRSTEGNGRPHRTAVFDF